MKLYVLEFGFYSASVSTVGQLPQTHAHDKKKQENTLRNLYITVLFTITEGKISPQKNDVKSTCKNKW